MAVLTSEPVPNLMDADGIVHVGYQVRFFGRFFPSCVVNVVHDEWTIDPYLGNTFEETGRNATCAICIGKART